MENIERLGGWTQEQLTVSQANDFVRLVALQTKFSDRPATLARSLALRNFATTFPRSLNADLCTKAAVAAATTSDATWAAPLSPVKPLADAFVKLLRPRTLLGRIPNLREVPANVSIAAQTTGGAYAWVGQGGPTPVTKSDYATVTVPATKCGGIVTVSQELAELSSPAAVGALREEMIAGCAQFLDVQFTDPAVAVSAGVSPASITNGAGTTASAGTSQANAATDMQVLTTQFLAVNPDAENAVILMTPSNAFAIARATGTQATLGYKGGTYFGVPVIVSSSVGARLIMLDANQILYADDGGLNVDVDVSTDALVQMDSNPADPTTSTTVLISLFQRNLIGLKITRMVTWKRVATTAVYYISSASYV